jgi:prolyl-tRNA synthetase
MRQSNLFTKTLKENIKEEKSINAQLLVRAGFVDKLSTGIYTFLPLGFFVMKKIENIIREEMQKIGGVEVLMPVLQPKAPWKKTGRWKHKEMFKTKSFSGKDYGLGWTHEEIITPLLQKFISSYKELPKYIFQIQPKMRDELRAKSGLLRNIEFTMKDLYSFHIDQEDLDNYYDKVKGAYFKIFTRCGLKQKTYLTLASGDPFSKYSHEFQTITPAGEDTIYICQKCNLAINKEIKKENPSCPECKSRKFKEEKAVEVGNIFKLGTKYSQAFHFVFKDKKGKEKLVVMGCYGIGLGRLIGTIAEIYYDEKGIIWPKEVTPFSFHLIPVFSGKNNIDKKIKEACDKIYSKLSSRQKNKNNILYDDRQEESVGVKFTESDLIGIPKRIVISKKTLSKNCVELKERKNNKIKLIKINKLN